MSSVVEFLRAFNRKERFFLVGHALGNPKFALSDAFRADLAATIGLAVPDGVFVAMDYHLTWIYAAVTLGSAGADISNPRAIPPQDNEARIIVRNQEDVDLLVAFEREDATHVVVIEAKGVTGWTNSQMASKAKRLCQIFGADGQRVGGVIPHFALISPWESKLLKPASWPHWMAPGGEIPHMHLPIPGRLLRVSQSDAQGHPLRDGSHWAVLPERGGDLVED
jgi:hypothetical protein